MGAMHDSCTRQISSTSRQAQNYHRQADRFSDAESPGKWSSGSASRRDLGSHAGSAGQSEASASPTETPQLSDTAADPHRNPTDETAAIPLLGLVTKHEHEMAATGIKTTPA